MPATRLKDQDILHVGLFNCRDMLKNISEDNCLVLRLEHGKLVVQNPGILERNVQCLHKVSTSDTCHMVDDILDISVLPENDFDDKKSFEVLVR